MFMQDITVCCYLQYSLRHISKVVSSLVIFVLWCLIARNWASLLHCVTPQIRHKVSTSRSVYCSWDLLVFHVPKQFTVSSQNHHKNCSIFEGHLLPHLPPPCRSDLKGLAPLLSRCCQAGRSNTWANGVQRVTVRGYGLFANSLCGYVGVVIVNVVVCASNGHFEGG